MSTKIVSGVSGADPAAGYSLFAVNYGSHKLEPADVLRGFLDDNDRQGLSSMQVVIRNKPDDWEYSEATIQACNPGQCLSLNSSPFFSPSTEGAWSTNLESRTRSKNVILFDEIKSGTRFQVSIRASLNKAGLDLSRFRAAAMARLSPLSFESDGAFPALC